MNIVNFTEDEQITVWIGACRYYLGRMTYAVEDFCRALIRHWPTLPDRARYIIQRDVEEAFRLDDATRAGAHNSRSLGMDCDRSQWEQVRALWDIPPEERKP